MSFWQTGATNVGVKRVGLSDTPDIFSYGVASRSSTSIDASGNTGRVGVYEAFLPRGRVALYRLGTRSGPDPKAPAFLSAKAGVLHLDRAHPLF